MLPINGSNNSNIPVPNYNYDEAVDSLARFLLFLSDDLKMQYPQNKKVSLAYSIDARNLLCNLGLEVRTEYKSFNINEVTKHIAAGCIIYIDGRDLS